MDWLPLIIVSVRAYHKDDLISLTNLTPGDFALVVRQSRFRPIHSAKALFDALADECQLKGGSKDRVGY